MSTASTPFHPLALLLCLAGLAHSAQAAPFTPTDDRQVLERVPVRAGNARARELQALRAAVQREPRNADAAAQLAQRWIEDALAEGDPRYVGYAQAALAPWWTEPAPPPSVRVQRAVVQQYGHHFAEALADLSAVTAAEPENAQAWAWQAAIHMVRADYAAARRACEGLAPLASLLTATACEAYVDSLTGRAAQAASELGDALGLADKDTSSEERVWALTRLAEIEERRGEFAVAEAAFREALTLNVADVYLLSAYADFLLDRGRAADVLALLKDRGRADVLLLRLALAAQAANDPRAAQWGSELSARFDAARARGDRTHEKEESRFALALRGDAPRALALARSNLDQDQREPADARVLLEAALAARSREAALPVLQWLDANQVESVVLRSLAERVKALP
jgi:tetratricopeptide (TPR) repeat protein